MHKLMVSLPVLVFTACVVDEQGPEADEDLTQEEARTAVLEVQESSAGDVATIEVIDVSTDFTIGGQIFDALNSIADFWESQADCTTVSMEGDVITVDFGSLDDGCEYRGHTWAGLDTITILGVVEGNLRVEHEFTQFTNGNVTLDGTATVTWSSSEDTRHVVTDYTLANFVTDTIVEVRGDHTTGRLDPDRPIRESGFTLDGSKEWTGENGLWMTELNDIEWRIDDPAPQAGAARVTSAGGKTLTIRYDRIDGNTTSARVTGPNGNEFLFRITADGTVVDDE